MDQIELNDGNADRYLLDTPGLSLLVFHSRTCGTCRIARQELPWLELPPVQRVCWIDAGENGGLVERYEVFHLPSMFLVRDGAFWSGAGQPGRMGPAPADQPGPGQLSGGTAVTAPPAPSAGRAGHGSMLLLCLCWGFQQIAIKLVAADVAPIMQIGLRSAFAALVLGVVMWRQAGWRTPMARGLMAGLLFGVEFLLVAQGLVYSTASHISVFLYTAPVFAALGLHWLLPEERLTPLQWLGVAIAFAGIAVAFGRATRRPPATCCSATRWD